MWTIFEQCVGNQLAGVKTARTPRPWSYQDLTQVCLSQVLAWFSVLENKTPGQNWSVL